MKTKKNKQNVFSLRLKNGINIMLNNRLVLRIYDFGKGRETETMAVDYTIYENWYKYMSSVLNQIQGGADYQGTSLAGRAAVSIKREHSLGCSGKPQRVRRREGVRKPGSSTDTDWI